MARVSETAALLTTARSSVIESYSSSDFADLKTGLTSIYAALLDIDDLVKRISAHGALDPPVSSDVEGPDPVYLTAEGPVNETRVNTPISGDEVSVILNGAGLTLPALTATAQVDKRYPVTMYINVLSVTGDANVRIDTSKIGEDDSRNPELYNIDVTEDGDVYTLSFPRDISCVDIIRSRGLLSQRTSMTRAYRTAASIMALLPGKVQRDREDLTLSISEGYVEDAPYSLFYIEQGRDVYVVDEGEVTLIKGRTPASSLASGTYAVVRETVSYSGEVLVQGSDVEYIREGAYVLNAVMDTGDSLVNDRGQVALVSEEGTVSSHIGSGKIVYATQSRLLSSVSRVTDAPQAVDISKQIDNDKLAEVYDFLTLAEAYIDSVTLCCEELSPMPVEYPIVTDIMRMHRVFGYDRAADLIADLMFDEYLSVSESEASYESMLAEHTKTLQVKVLT